MEKLAKTYGVNPRQNQKKKFKIISWKELNQIKSSNLFSLVHHGHWHYPMSQFSQEELLEDIETNVRILKNKIGIEPKYFVYPFGEKRDYNKKTANALKKHGFEFGFTFETRDREIDYQNPFDIPRVMAR